jgi:hypothetical protein
MADDKTDGTLAETVGIGLLDGAMTNPIPWIKSELAPDAIKRLTESALALAAARQIYTHGDNRNAFMLALQAAIETLRSLDTPSELLKPLLHLLDGLTDLERGSIDPAFKTKVSHNKSAHTAKWNGRACLVGALEARFERCKDVELIGDAAKKVCRFDRQLSYKSLLEWRKQLISGGEDRGKEILEATKIAIERQRAALSGDEAKDWLKNVEERLIRDAQEYGY